MRKLLKAFIQKTKVGKFFADIGNLLWLATQLSEVRKERGFSLQKFIDESSALKGEVEEIKGKLTPEKVQELKDPSIIRSEHENLFVRVESKSNKDVMDFHVSLPTFTDDNGHRYSFCFPEKTVYVNDEKFIPETVAILRDNLYKTGTCSSFTLEPFMVEFVKAGALPWGQVKPLVAKAIFDTFDQLKMIEESVPVDSSEATN